MMRGTQLMFLSCEVSFVFPILQSSSIGKRVQVHRALSKLCRGIGHTRSLKQDWDEGLCGLINDVLFCVSEGVSPRWDADNICGPSACVWLCRGCVSRRGSSISRWLSGAMWHAVVFYGGIAVVGVTALAILYSGGVMRIARRVCAQRLLQ